MDRQLPEEIDPNTFQFEFYEGKGLYRSEPSYFYTKNQDINFYCPDINKNPRLEEAFNEDEYLLKNFENKITLAFEAYKFDVFVYTPYMIINKTTLSLIFGEINSNKNDEGLVCIPPLNSEFFHGGDAKRKFSIMTDGYRWSEKFDINTFGISGLASLKRSTSVEPNDNDALIEKYNAGHIDIGVIFSTLSSPFGKTHSVTFVPRYVIVNETGQNLIFVQDHKKA
jgi:hypothetical protein